MSAVAFCRSVSEFCERVAETGHALSMQAHAVGPLSGNLSRVRWVPALVEGQQRESERTRDVGFGEYMRSLRQRDYSLLLNDGGIVQISADFRAGIISAYRFVYLPCAINFEVSEIQMEAGIYPLEDFISDMNADELKDRLCIRS